MSFESMDFTYHRDIDKKFTYKFHWAQLILILCKRLNKDCLIKMLKHQTQTGFGTKVRSMCSKFDFDTEFPSGISIFRTEKMSQHGILLI